MKLKIAISPCPNDTFIFENIFNKKNTIDGIEFEFHFFDIEELNTIAQNNAFDLVKISYAQYFKIKHNYNLLRSGGAMGYGVGPLLVKKKDQVINWDNALVAIPGEHTTANFLLTYLLPHIKNKKEILFSNIEDAVLTQQVGAGLLIHEGRFTYAEKGLEKIEDLGALWQEKTSLPIPLGCIVINKNLPVQLQVQVQELIKESICNYDKGGVPIISEFIKLHAQEMDESVMLQHINLYVNDFSKDIGVEGEAVIKLMEQMLA